MKNKKLRRDFDEEIGTPLSHPLLVMIYDVGRIWDGGKLGYIKFLVI